VHKIILANTHRNLTLYIRSNMSVAKSDFGHLTIKPNIFGHRTIKTRQLGHLIGFKGGIAYICIFLKKILPPFHIESHLDFSRYIPLDTHLDIHYV